MAICLVTGGAGFIGSHLVDTLVIQGHEVRVLDNFSTGNLANLEKVLGKVEIRTGDLTDPQAVRAAVEGVELVFHQAGQSSALHSADYPEAIHNACATGTLLVLRAAREAGVRRVIYASSSSVYGNSKKLLHCEEDATHPVSPYGVAELAGEQYCTVFSHQFGLETVRLRYFNVFGPRQPHDTRYTGVIPCFLQSLLAGRSPVIHGDGLQSRDFTYVSDVVQANLLAAEARRVSGKVYNIAFGRQTSLLDLLESMNEILGSQLKPIHVKPRPGDVRHSVADTSLAQTELGFCPCMDLKEGLRECLKYYVDRQAERDPGLNGPTGPHLKLFGVKSTQIHSSS